MSSETAQWLLARWLARAGEALEGMVGEEPSLSVPPKGPLSADLSAGLFWRQKFSLESGEAWVAVPDVVWTAVGARVLALAGIENPAPDELRSTFLEILGQSLSLLASDLTPRSNHEVTLGEGSIVEALPLEADWTPVQVTLSSGALPPLFVAWSAGLIARMEVPSAPVEEAAPPAPADAVPPRTMDLLLEVDLPVSVSFGRTQMRLKEVVKLTTGSIVELNRSINEPVEIIVNNCVIARGEVVVVDGNYGVRIKQIVSRQERLRSLF